MHGRSCIGVSADTAVAALRSAERDMLLISAYVAAPLSLRSRFSEAFPQGDFCPLRVVLVLISRSNILNLACVRVWFHVFDSEITIRIRYCIAMYKVQQ